MWPAAKNIIYGYGIVCANENLLSHVSRMILDMPFTGICRIILEESVDVCLSYGINTVSYSPVFLKFFLIPC